MHTRSVAIAELLESHEKIAWDVDGTLLGGPYSHDLRSYVVEHPEKQHHVVTFRDPERVAETYRELALHGIRHLHLASMNSCPAHLWQAFASRGRSGDHAHVDECMEWKAITAASLGCTVLVDDLHGCVADGCAKHGIEFIHAHDPRLAPPAPKRIMLDNLDADAPVGVLRIERIGRGAFSNGAMLDLAISGGDPAITRRVLINDARSKSESAPELVDFLRDPGGEDLRAWRHGWPTIEAYREYCGEFAFRAALAARGVCLLLYVVPRRWVRIGDTQCVFKAEKAHVVQRLDLREVG